MIEKKRIAIELQQRLLWPSLTELTNDTATRKKKFKQYVTLSGASVIQYEFTGQGSPQKYFHQYWSKPKPRQARPFF